MQWCTSRQSVDEEKNPVRTVKLLPERENEEGYEKQNMKMHFLGMERKKT